jgi:hypothetical protein
MRLPPRSRLLDAFEDIRWDPEEILDFGDRFLVTARQRGHGSGSGVAVSEPVFQLFKLRRAWWSGRRTFWIARRPSKPPGCGSSAVAQ